MKSLSPSQVADAVVVLSSHYQFGPNECVAQPRVSSRMLLWCKSGRGTARVNGVPSIVQLDDFLFLPWNRAITYQPDPREPFLVGGIHIIPFHHRGEKVVYDAAHREPDSLSRSTARKDMDIPLLRGVKRGSFAQSPALRHLAEYTVQRFASRNQSEWEARSLAQLLLITLFDYFWHEPMAGTNVPPELQQMIQFVRSHIHQKLSLSDLARFSKRSPSFVCRLFQKHLRMSPVTFIIQTRMDLARQLLATSSLPVAEVGCRVGIEDAYYFSKLFRKTVGCSPLQHRKKASLL